MHNSESTEAEKVLSSVVVDVVPVVFLDVEPEQSGVDAELAQHRATVPRLDLRGRSAMSAQTRWLFSSQYIVVCQDTRPLCLDHPPPSARQEIIKRHIILEGYPFRINNLPILDRTLITNELNTSPGHRLRKSLVPTPSPPRRPSFTPLRQLGLRLRNHPEQTLSHLPPCRAPLLDERDDALVLPAR